MTKWLVTAFVGAGGVVAGLAAAPHGPGVIAVFAVLGAVGAALVLIALSIAKAVYKAFTEHPSSTAGEIADDDRESACPDPVWRRAHGLPMVHLNRTGE